MENSFITPLDRHDIYAVSRRIDDITDKVKDLTDFIEFFEFVPIKKNIEMAQRIQVTVSGITEAVKCWAVGDDDGFWDAIMEAKRKSRIIKNLYWESLKKLDSDIFTLEEIFDQEGIFPRSESALLQDEESHRPDQRYQDQIHHLTLPVRFPIIVDKVYATRSPAYGWYGVVALEGSNNEI